MAWLEMRGNQFHLGIRLGSRKIKRSLQTDSEEEAQEVIVRVERRLRLIEQGDLEIPEDADPITFLLSDGKLTQPVTIGEGTSLKGFFARYLNDLPENTVESNTLYTIKIHLKHLQRLLGDELAVERLKYADLQSYVDSRSKEDGKRSKKISPVTIRKELTSFSGVWACPSRTSARDMPPSREQKNGPQPRSKKESLRLFVS